MLVFYYNSVSNSMETALETSCNECDLGLVTPFGSGGWGTRVGFRECMGGLQSNNVRN